MYSPPAAAASMSFAILTHQCKLAQTKSESELKHAVCLLAAAADQLALCDELPRRGEVFKGSESEAVVVRDRNRRLLLHDWIV